MSVAVTQINYFSVFLDAVKDYLSGFKIGSSVIPVYIDGHTKEIKTHSYPHFYVSKLKLIKDNSRKESGYNVDYIDGEDGDDAEKYSMKKPFPAIIEFSLEIADSNPINYFAMQQKLMQKFSKDKTISFDYGNGDIVEYPLFAGDIIQNEVSRVYHGIASCRIPIYVDSATVYDEAELITKITMNDEVIHEAE